MCIKCAEKNKLNADAILSLAQAALALNNLNRAGAQVTEILNTISQLTYKEERDADVVHEAQTATTHQTGEGSSQTETLATNKESLGKFIDFLTKALNAKVIKLERNTTDSGHEWMFKAPRDVNHGEVLEMVEALSKETGVSIQQIVIV